MNNDAAAEQCDGTPLNKPDTDTLMSQLSWIKYATVLSSTHTWWPVGTGHPRCPGGFSDHSAAPTAGRLACKEPEEESSTEC